MRELKRLNEIMKKEAEQILGDADTM